MALFDRLAVYREQGLAALRIMTGLLFLEHGTMKLFSFPVAQGGDHLSPLMLTAALLEFIGGILITVGFLTRPVAFILSGQMAVAYFMAHASRGFWPALNNGEAAILFSFIFIYLFFAGAGAFSVDNRKKI
ncbi:DoxX family protein [Agrobacterium sp. Ap1]|uniref:DoxX family protein n=1 Tax=Agrobacterium sp. Ap1 TaxID=2815337 RepID=UPI0011D063C8|nr:DoxX family protein [Agrobacterium sp. Ap1]MBO0141964.1 DoxX family protein [Agrobacterium sp. Ap1]